MNEFNPNYAVAPGETLKEIIEEKGWSLEDFSRISHISLDIVVEILEANKSIDVILDYLLEKATGGERSFWLNHQMNYQETIKRLEREGKTLKREGGFVYAID